MKRRSNRNPVKADLARLARGLVRLVPFVVVGVVAVMVWDRWIRSDAALEVEQTTDGFSVVTARVGEPIDLEAEWGSVDDLTAREATAMCWTHHRYRQHQSLDTDVIVVSDRGLIRSAELLAGEYFGDPAAAHAENLGSMSGDWSVSAVMSEFEDDGDWVPADLERARQYLLDRRDEPGTGASEEFVVFEVSRTTTLRSVVRMRVGNVVNADEPTHRNTAVFGSVLSPDRSVGLMLDRGHMNDVCQVVG